MSSQPTPEQIAEGFATGIAALGTAFGPASGGITVVAAGVVSPLIVPIVHAIHEAQADGADPVAAARAALARTTALDPGPLGPRADAIDAASIARVRAEQLASTSRISIADVAVLRRLAQSVSLSAEETATLDRVAGHFDATIKE